MPLITGSVFLAGALLSCLLPIALLIAFATFFTRQARQLPPNAETPAPQPPPSPAVGGNEPGVPGGPLANA